MPFAVSMTYEAPNEANTASGFVPSNNAYKPTQGAIRHSEDTELYVGSGNPTQSVYRKNID